MIEPAEIAARLIKEIEEQVKSVAGEAASKKVMQGKDEIPAAKDLVKGAMWVKEAIDRLDAAATPEKCRQIMTACGHACLAMNIQGTEASKELRRKCATEEEFLKLELNATPEITRYERNGNILYWYYTPRKIGKGIRCVCPLLSMLPESVNISRTYCHCSRAFVQAYWEGILGRPLKVELGKTSLTGAKECKFIIHL
jgi:hypothetical protein